MRNKSHACGIWFLYGTDLKIEMWNLKSVGDRFERILTEIMKASHEFCMYVIQVRGKKKICPGRIDDGYQSWKAWKTCYCCDMRTL